MIAILKPGTTPEQTQHLVQWLKRLDLDVHISQGKEVTILGLIGDTSKVDMDLLSSLEIVDSVKRVSEPFKQVNRKFHPNDSIIQVGNVKIGGGYFAMIAGPCSVESEDQIAAWNSVRGEPLVYHLSHLGKGQHILVMIYGIDLPSGFGVGTRQTAADEPQPDDTDLHLRTSRISRTRWLSSWNCSGVRDWAPSHRAQLGLL